MQRLAHKKALVTGGTSGIGFATARCFVTEGARVAITGTHPARLEEARAQLGPDSVGLLADAGDIRAVTKQVRALRDSFGKIDVVFMNAGIADLRPLEQWDEESFDRSIAINLKGPFFLIQALLPILANPASIVLNTSINAHIGMKTTAVYAATKAGLISLVRTLSGELIGRGIRVNAVSPGPIATPLYDKVGMTDADLQGLIGMIPLGRQGVPDEIAEAVVFLASDAGAFAVGSEFVIDGGMSTI